ncbi:hypothetical protein JCM16303_001954 [Sporobolomyces ruberrimus]
MDTYLDPSLGGPLAFLDSSTQLHAPSDPSNQPLNAFDYDSWLNPVSAPPYDGSQGLSVAHSAPQVGPLGLDGRGSLSSAHFGVHLHPETRASPKSNSAPLSPLSPAVHSSASTHLPFAAQEYPDGMFHPRSNLASQSYSHPSPSSLASAHSEPSTESMSIAMYDRRVGEMLPSPGGGGSSRELVGDYSASLRSLRNHSTSSSTSGASSAAKPSRSPSTHGNALVPIARQGAQSRGAPAANPQSPLRSSQGRSPPTTRSRGPRVPQADESVPEAALHLLRLALPTGSTGSAATNTTGDDDRSCDEDAEGESDDTSIHSTDLKALSKLFPDVNVEPVPFETTVWNHSEGQPPLHVQRGGGPGSRRPSAASSAASARVRQHNPARAQREASVASVRSRIGSDAPSTSTPAASVQSSSTSGPAAAVGRRSQARGRKTGTPSQADGEANVDAGADSDGGASGGEYQEGDAYEDGEATDTGKGKGKKKLGKGVAARGKGKATKRASTAAEDPPPAKRARVVNGRAVTVSAPRKPRRQAYIPPNLSNRTFPPELEISPNFPRFYRSFPISSAIPPESYVLQIPGSSSASQTAGTPQGSVGSAQGLSLDVLPTPPTPIYEQHFGFPSHSPYSTGHSPPLASTSSAGSNTLPNISVDVHGAFVIHDEPHAHSHPHSHVNTHVHPHYSASSYSSSPYSLPVHPTSSHDMAPPPILQPPPIPPPNSTGPFAHLHLMNPPADSRWNKAGDPFNLYYPRFVKGSADDKCGLCPICAESPERGGEGEQKWLKLKNSSYVYHMSYAHGLSNVTGLPFSPPVELRNVDLPHHSKDTRAQMTEGRCHKCDDWIPLLSVKNIDAIVPELIWWKHAKKCHGDTTIPGERDPYVVDELYNFVLSRKNDSTY